MNFYIYIFYTFKQCAQIIFFLLIHLVSPLLVIFDNLVIILVYTHTSYIYVSLFVLKFKKKNLQNAFSLNVNIILVIHSRKYHFHSYLLQDDAYIKRSPHFFFECDSVITLLNSANTGPLQSQ